MRILKSRAFFWACFGVFLLCCLLLAVLSVFAAKGFLLINPVPAPTVFAVAVTAGFLLLISFFARRGFRKWAYVPVCAVFALAAYAFFQMMFLSSIFARDEVEYLTSPDGRHRILVYESSFIDAYYYAHQVKWGIFYKENDSSVSRHDVGAGAKWEIEWKRDRAIVYILFDGQNRNEEESITVMLD